MSGLKTFTWRTLSVAALLLSANVASADYLFGNSGNSSNNGVNRLTVNGTIDLFSGANQGWWSAEAPATDANDNYFVGVIDVDEFTKQYVNNFFIFDISGLVAPVSSAVLNIQLYKTFSNLGAPSITYGLFDVSTDIADLNQNAGTSVSIFSDLGSGISYGAFSIATGLPKTTVVSLTLNSAGVADLNAAIEKRAGQFAIGGTLVALAPTEHSLPDSTSTFVLFGAAAAGIWVLRRKKSA